MEIWVKKLLNWYDREKRDLPWRRSSDPYAIWVSEIMLQQTRVETVLDYYQRWMRYLPDIRSLAEEDPQTVLKLWEGLGYYSRARNLQKAAQFIMDEYNGIFPAEYAQIRKLPGVGPYTAGAIASIAFQQPAAAVDGNVLRVCSRMFALAEINQKPVQKEIQMQVAGSFPTGRAGDYTQALMELGALICLPGNPVCMKCPVTEECQAYLQGKQKEWPIRQEKARVKQVKRSLAVIQNENQILMHQRPGEGLLASMWEFPGVDGVLKKDMSNRFAGEYGLHIKIGKHFMDTRHVFSHLEWDMKVYFAKLEKPEELEKLDGFLWADKPDLDKLAIPTAFKKIRDALMNSESINR